MGATLGLLAALCWGVSDFTAGMAGRRGDATAVAGVSQSIGLLAAVIAVLAQRPAAPGPETLAWGALSGIGSGVGVLAL
ncbi:MAG TPA: hypothetical protein VFN57_14545, partial [Thermomicrobiaceae bacterium]|nr:hypothetical protein [Thermomicrobiaceae bacterium]